MPGTVLKYQLISSSQILQGRHCYHHPHFTNEENVSERLKDLLLGTQLASGRAGIALLAVYTIINLLQRTYSLDSTTARLMSMNKYAASLLSI